MSAVVEAVQSSSTGSDEFEPIHISCCNPDRALCGWDLTDADMVPKPEPEDECVVCVEFEDGPCDSPTCPDRNP